MHDSIHSQSCAPTPRGRRRADSCETPPHFAFGLGRLGEVGKWRRGAGRRRKPLGAMQLISRGVRLLPALNLHLPLKRLPLWGQKQRVSRVQVLPGDGVWGPIRERTMWPRNEFFPCKLLENLLRAGYIDIGFRPERPRMARFISTFSDTSADKRGGPSNHIWPMTKGIMRTFGIARQCFCLALFLAMGAGLLSGCQMESADADLPPVNLNPPAVAQAAPSAPGGGDAAAGLFRARPGGGS